MNNPETALLLERSTDANSLKRNNETAEEADQTAAQTLNDDAKS